MKLEAAFKGSAMNMHNANFSDEWMRLGFTVTKSMQVAVVFKKTTTTTTKQQKKPNSLVILEAC